MMATLYWAKDLYLLCLVLLTAYLVYVNIPRNR